ncbi:MAG TPA: hypothetical protein PLL30_05660 [Candidatus Krumholzibacteria bacterium]|nr:hypothetical protein [Candidatus Krumholzibacteria bacterium]HPD71249.1 hypothetical protein [Candidatus Krumholzibacteria bacterium]HRY39051.1 hypothetical protein [Candidatus Krumholzibacteria bacterium]
MYLGIPGRHWTTAPVALLTLVTALLAFGPAAGPALAQTASCELPLTVPETSDVEIVLQPTSRGPGVLLTWPEPDDAASTCIALTDTAGIGIPMVASGDYRDGVDRTLRFEFLTSGTVSDPARNRFVCAWNNANTLRTGRLGGEINLSNTGGLWLRDGGGFWTQRNAGLPRNLPYTNLLDLAASADGTLLLALSSAAPSAQIQVNPRGVFRSAPGGSWTEVAPALFGTGRQLSAVALSPSNSARFAVGSRQNGLYVTADGGETFTQWTSNLDPSFVPMPSAFEVTALRWTGTRFYAAVANFGLFVSGDGGASFTRLGALRVPQAPGDPVLVLPAIRTIVEDPTDSDRILVGLTDHGIWESNDAGATWHSLWVDYGPGAPANWRQSGRSLAVDPAAPQTIWVGTVALGLFRTLDNGANWESATAPFDSFTTRPQVTEVVLHDGQLLALADGYGLLESTDNGLSWTDVAVQPFNRNGRCLRSTPAGLLRPTTYGGIYLPGTTIDLSSTLTASATNPEYRNLQLGVSLTFGNGRVVLPDQNGDGIPEPVVFNLVCQDYQGWIVWRSDRDDPDNMVMVGRYDKNNPESCIEGFCGDDNYVILPGCFSERRAACFDFGTPGYASFYDGGIYNGFTYHYAVTPFDYGDISMVVDPLALATPLVFPARFPGDPQGEGPGNRRTFQVNLDAAAPVDGREIYVYPNPLRLGAGIAGGEGEEVIWTNLPPDSQIEVFTLAGDEIATLPEPGEPQEGANIYWKTRNDDEQLLASGIYVWRVIMPERGDFWGKLVIIR